MAILCGIPVSAHTVSLTYAEFHIGEREVDSVVRMPIPELDLLFGLDRNHDGKIDAVEWAAARETIAAYALSKIAIESLGHPLSGEVVASAPWTDAEGHEFIELRIRHTNGNEALGQVTLRCDVLRDVVSTHKTLARIDAGGQQREFVFENGGTYSVAANPSWIESAGQFVRMGLLHIFTGYDHIAFLLGVVLVGGKFWQIVKIVTSFTLAHSVTLALAAFHILSPPSRIVESGIALSIMYIALENLLFQRFDRRWMVTFFFGLVHGFGFASALEEVRLTRQLLATALFSFNLGVEIGQVCIVALMVPPLLWLHRRQGKVHAAMVRAMSLGILGLGAYWFWQRVWEAPGR